jgi:hypothetical protein
MKHPFVGVVYNLHFGGLVRYEIVIQDDMLTNDAGHIRIAHRSYPFSACFGMIFPRLQAPGLGNVMESRSSLNKLTVAHYTLLRQMIDKQCGDMANLK